MQNKTALTVHEASEYTGIGRNNLRQLIAWNKIPTLNVGRKTLIRVEALDHFIQVNEGNNLTSKHEVISLDRGTSV